MKAKYTTTVVVIVATVVALTCYDVFAILAWGVDSTISRVILSASFNSPVIAFAAGFLCGHLFAPQRVNK